MDNTLNKADTHLSKEVTHPNKADTHLNKEDTLPNKADTHPNKADTHLNPLNNPLLPKLLNHPSNPLLPNHPNKQAVPPLKWSEKNPRPPLPQPEVVTTTDAVSVAMLFSIMKMEKRLNKSRGSTDNIL